MTLTTILCDLDGTLVDSRRDIAAAFQHAWQTVIDRPPPSATAIAQHIGKPLADMLHELGGALSPALLSAFLTTYRQMYASRDACLSVPYPGVIATLQALSRFTLGIVTTKEPGQAELVIRRLGLVPFFQHIQGGTPDLRLKPAPDTVLAALAALHCPPSHAIMVGDTPADMLAGKAAGVTTCAVTYGYARREALLQCEPDATIDTFGALVPIVLASRHRPCDSLGMATCPHQAASREGEERADHPTSPSCDGSLHAPGGALPGDPGLAISSGATLD